MKVAHQFFVCFVSSMLIGLIPASKLTSTHLIPVKSKKEITSSIQDVNSKLNNQYISESEGKQLNEITSSEDNVFFVQPSMNHLCFSLSYYDLIGQVRKIHFYLLHSFIYSGLSPPAVA